MNLLKPFVLLTLGTAASGAFANPSDSVGPPLRDFVEKVSRLTGERYAYGTLLLKRSVGLSRNVEVTEENASQILSNVLHMNQLTRVPTGSPASYYIVEAKYAVQSPLPVYEAGADQSADQPQLPDNFDMVTLKYRLGDTKVAPEFQRMLYDLVPRSARISVLPDSGTLIITDTARNLRRLVDIIRKHSPAAPDR